MTEGFTKLFASIIHSTVWREPDHVRLVWVTMLAMADRNGYVGASLPGLADAARVTLSECEDALEKFMAPDPYSRSQEHEGRRIELADRGWQLLNYKVFREARQAEVRREQNREAQRRYRDKRKQERKQGKQGKPESAHAEAEAEAKAEEDRQTDQASSLDAAKLWDRHSGGSFAGHAQWERDYATVAAAARRHWPTDSQAKLEALSANFWRDGGWAQQERAAGRRVTPAMWAKNIQRDVDAVLGVVEQPREPGVSDQEAARRAAAALWREVTALGEQVDAAEAAGNHEAARALERQMVEKRKEAMKYDWR